MPARYLETVYVDPDQLRPYPGNPNQGDIGIVRSSVRNNGQYRSVVARKLPDGTLELLAGHTTTAATGLEVGKTRVEVIEADDATARRIVAADNQTARKATMDERLLLELLEQADDEEGLDGTGFTPPDLEDLARMVAPPDLDDFARDVGEPQHGDGWPTLRLKVPHHLSSAWEGHLDEHKGDVPAAFAALLGLHAHPEGAGE